MCDGDGDAGVVCAGWTAGVVCAGWTAGVVCVVWTAVVCVADEDWLDELDELLDLAGGFGALFRFGSAGAAPTAVIATFCCPWTLVTGASWDEVAFELDPFVAEPAANATPKAAATTITAPTTNPFIPLFGTGASSDCPESIRPTSPVAVAPAIASSPLRALALDDTRRTAISEERSLTETPGVGRQWWGPAFFLAP